MDYTAADVKKLRDETGATFADCRNALAEAKSWNEAVTWLEARTDQKAEKMRAAGRETKQGGIFSYVHHNNTLGVLLELNCSTDFVARSKSFRQLANDLALQIAGVAPKYIRSKHSGCSWGCCCNRPRPPDEGKGGASPRSTPDTRRAPLATHGRVA